MNNESSANPIRRWVLTVDWCSQGLRGVFCSKRGSSFIQDHEHTEDEAFNILDVFLLVLSPKSILMDFEEVMKFNRFIPLGEFKSEYGFAVTAEKLEEWNELHTVDKT